MRAHVTNSLPHTRTNAITNKKHKLRTHTHVRARTQNTLFFLAKLFVLMLLLLLLFLLHELTHIATSARLLINTNGDGIWIIIVVAINVDAYIFASSARHRCIPQFVVVACFFCACCSCCCRFRYVYMCFKSTKVQTTV